MSTFDIGVADGMKIASMYERDGKLHHEIAPGVTFVLPDKDKAREYKKQVAEKDPDVLKTYTGPSGRTIEIRKTKKRAKRPPHFGRVNLRFTEAQKRRMYNERRDPRLYSNLRGMLTFESRKERVAAHRRLSPGTRKTKWEAFREGFFRRKKKAD